MNEKRAQKLLKAWIEADDGLYGQDPWVDWGQGNSDVSLEGDFDPETLEAIAWWMRHKRVKS
mgnify:CR=1 FL=1